ncbi:MAG TPA: HAD family hydrolase [Burkholderiales bacterium]|nr:HAD family hydrolase [Burkholderiales bacterium]
MVSGAAPRRAVFLDRDGVLNRAFVRDGKPYPPGSVAEVEILSGVTEALEALRAAGFANVIITNQPDVALGKQRREVVDAINRYLSERLAVDTVKVCYHADADNCACRKPKPGMLLEAAEEMGINLSSSYLVGDRWRDVEAGHAAGCRVLFVDYGYRERKPEEPYLSVKSLPEAVRIILGGSLERHQGS